MGLKPSWILMATWLLASPAFAHGGGLNAEGCHTDRRTGRYHCHRGTGYAPARERHPPSYVQTPAPSRLDDGAGAYRNCAHARAAGAAPVRRGEPGYGPHLDRDGDGVGCEPYRGRR